MPRLLSQPGDARVLVDDLGQDRLLVVGRLHGQLHAALELFQEPLELFPAWPEEFVDEGRLVLEDDAEPERQDRPPFERGGENFGVIQQVAPLRLDRRRSHRARERGKPTVGHDADRLAADSARSVGRSDLGPGDAVAVETADRR